MQTQLAFARWRGGSTKAALIALLATLLVLGASGMRATTAHAETYDDVIGALAAIDLDDIVVYCNRKYSTNTGSHECWQGHPHKWDINQATYYGGGYTSSLICADLVGYWTRINYFGKCGYGFANTGLHVNTNSWYDAGVWNYEGHSVTGAGIYVYR